MNRWPNRQNKGGSIYHLGHMFQIWHCFWPLRPFGDCIGRNPHSPKILINHKKIKPSIFFMFAAGLLGPNFQTLYSFCCTGTGCLEHGHSSRLSRESRSRSLPLPSPSDRITGEGNSPIDLREGNSLKVWSCPDIWNIWVKGYQHIHVVHIDSSCLLVASVGHLQTASEVRGEILPHGTHNTTSSLLMRESKTFLCRQLHRVSFLLLRNMIRKVHCKGRRLSPARVHIYNIDSTWSECQISFTAFLSTIWHLFLDMKN